MCPTSGTIPVTVHGISVEYVSTFGTVATVWAAVKATGEIRIANLALGESVTIPIGGGLTSANVLIGASAYTDGVHEATINVMVVGLNV